MKQKKPKHSKRRTRPVKGFVKPLASVRARETIKPRSTKVNTQKEEDQ